MYTVLILSLLTGFVSLGVDIGRVQLVKTELRGATDAAARAGAKGLATSSTAARAAAITAAGYNKADAQWVALDNSDIEVGKWNPSSKIFTPNGTPYDAVRVTAKRTTAEGNAVPMLFGRMLGRSSMDVTVRSVAYIDTDPVPSWATTRSNPWLAGMPAGTTANGYDSAPTASPTVVATDFDNGDKLTFNVTGTSSNQGGVEDEYAADGNLNWIIHNYAGDEHGIADLQAPISSLIGVFLDDDRPDDSSAPSSLDFSTPSSRDFTQLKPKLKQPFFIGDGKRANGDLQKFVVPKGAKRLFVGSMDGQQWSDNAGGFNVTVNGVPSTRIVTVQ